MLNLRKAQEVFMHYVYEITNTLNGKRYFGHTNVDPCSFTFEELLYLADNNSFLAHLYNSMKKYGKNAFKVTIVDHCEDEAEAKESLELRRDFGKTDVPGRGYNYKDAELIPYNYKDAQLIQYSEAISEAPQEPYSLFDVITVCTKSLCDMKDCYINSEFVDFMVAYDSFNRYIPITGVLDGFCMAQSSMMMQLLRVCKDALGVYIEEHSIV